jgi:hypothetical protein
VCARRLRSATGVDDPELALEQDDECGTPPWQGTEQPRHGDGGRSNVWDVGACVQALCFADPGPSAGTAHSCQLNAALATALEPDVGRRSDACAMLALLQRLHAEPRVVRAPLPEGLLRDVLNGSKDSDAQQTSIGCKIGGSE